MVFLALLRETLANELEQDGSGHCQKCLHREHHETGRVYKRTSPRRRLITTRPSGPSRGWRRLQNATGRLAQRLLLAVIQQSLRKRTGAGGTLERRRATATRTCACRRTTNVSAWRCKVDGSQELRTEKQYMTASVERANKSGAITTGVDMRSTTQLLTHALRTVTGKQQMKTVWDFDADAGWEEDPWNGLEDFPGRTRTLSCPPCWMDSCRNQTTKIDAVFFLCSRLWLLPSPRKTPVDGRGQKGTR